MKIEILRCVECKEFTLQEACTSCNQKCISPKPAKYSVEDKWGKYRRLFKEQQASS